MFKFLLKLFGIGINNPRTQYVSSEDLRIQNQKSSKHKFINLDVCKLNKDIVNLIPQQFIEQYYVIPIALEDNILKLAMIDTENIIAIDDIKFATGFDIEPLQAEESAIKRTINRFFSYTINDEIDLDEMHQLIDESPIVRIFNLIVSQAIREKASEIHLIFDEEPDKFTVYYMVNGVKHEVMQPPNYIKSEIINHTKVIANLDILKQNCHQDGKISFKYEGIRHESVITVVPSVNGNDENIIIKILN